MKYGEVFLYMSYGISGAAVDHNVAFKDPHYTNTPAPAWCETVAVKSTTVKESAKKQVKKTATAIYYQQTTTTTTKITTYVIKDPMKCVNFGLKSITTTTKVTHHKVNSMVPVVVTPAPTPTTTPTTVPSAPSSPPVTNPCQGFSSTIPGTQVSGGNCIVVVCGNPVIITAANYGSITINITGGNCNTNPPPPPPPACTQGTSPGPGYTWNQSTCSWTAPPPPSHYTQVSCIGFEELSGNGSEIIKCTVADDNGGPISLTANSNNTNSHVSGINCWSQGGTPSCSGNGTFEFRVGGANNGSTVLSSSVTVVASANGVPQTFTSDPFAVDQSSGGF